MAYINKTDIHLLESMALDQLHLERVVCVSILGDVLGQEIRECPKNINLHRFWWIVSEI